jgi:hypothetical protein
MVAFCTWAKGSRGYGPCCFGVGLNTKAETRMRSEPFDQTRRDVVVEAHDPYRVRWFDLIAAQRSNEHHAAYTCRTPRSVHHHHTPPHSVHRTYTTQCPMPYTLRHCARVAASRFELFARAAATSARRDARRIGHPSIPVRWNGASLIGSHLVGRYEHRGNVELPMDSLRRDDDIRSGLRRLRHTSANCARARLGLEVSAKDSRATTECPRRKRDLRSGQLDLYSRFHLRSQAEHVGCKCGRPRHPICNMPRARYQTYNMQRKSSPGGGGGGGGAERCPTGTVIRCK